HYRFGGHLLQVELQTTRQNRDGNLLRVSGCQDEFDVRRRLFQRFEHGVERVPGQHVDFVDHVDFETAAARGVYRLFEQLRHFFYAAVGRGIKFNIVDKTASIDFGAC